MRKLVIFDFDGTLTTKDSLNEFLRFSTSKKDYFFKMTLFLPTYLLYKVGIIKNDIAKQKLIKSFFASMDEKSFKKLAKDFSKELRTILRNDIYSKFQKHKSDGDDVVVVSASFECWLKPWCEAEGVELLSTKLEFKDGILTGKFLNENCYGEQKVKRVKESYELDSYDEIISYGDSKGDEYIFAMSDYFERV